MKLVKIKSKKLQNLDNSYHICYYSKCFGNKFVFKNMYEYLWLSPPKGTIEAKLEDGVWYWVIDEKEKEEW